MKLSSPSLPWQRRTAEFHNNFQITEQVRALISKFPDTERSLSRLIRLGPNPRDLFSLKIGMNLFFELKEKLMHLDENSITQGNLFEDNLKKVLEELDLAIIEDPVSYTHLTLPTKA